MLRMILCAEDVAWIWKQNNTFSLNVNMEKCCGEPHEYQIQ